MNSNDSQQQLQDLADRIDRLTDVSRRLIEENRSLRHSQEQLIAERSHLVNKNDLARTRVEAMIQRLKSLEQNA
jgi:cell division protein ZapB